MSRTPTAQSRQRRVSDTRRLCSRAGGPVALAMLLLLMLLLLLSACDASGTTQAPTQAPPTATLPAPALTSTVTGVGGAAITAGTTAIPTPALDALLGPSPTAPPDRAIAPMWVRDAVLYQIFVRNFTPEGTLAAAQKRLPDLKDMGVSLIYLMPIQVTGALNRKGSLGSPYSITDYYAVDPAQGTEADLKAFVDAAHGLGMHVIMDLVANHTSWDSVLSKQHPDWFKHDDKGNFVPPQPDWTDVIQIDHSKPGVLQYFVEMTTHYVQADGIDGFRCDYSAGVPLDFWKAWRAALKKIAPDLFLLSENDDTQLTQAFDATYDQSLYQDVVPAALSNVPHRLIVDAATNYANNGPYLLQARFFENHDHDRVAAPFQSLPPAALEAATTYLLTTDGIPFIENGQEVGITHTISLFDRDPILWQQGNPQLRDFFKRTLAIRNAHPALRHGDIIDLGTISTGTAAFMRRTAGEQVLVVLSFGKGNGHITLDPSLARHQGLDLETNKAVDLSAGLDVTPWSWRIIQLK